ncbi:DUF1289 domain-containing protein [Jiella endophytica]|uniref:DUF1289 domain-containing protein n=1 Tax=Jiella endophytica TaxID=2558362 RepID=A0A4Y8RBV5_9HYPH|nr:DUF1289 domain-containing protein [Jiella endophytica]TFF18682.1 DUF1289 domain-containing protein [Jiella endophytica]
MFVAKRWAKAPSPCIGVCKFRGEDGSCIGCSMTRRDKKRFKRLEKKPKKKAFFRELVARLVERGRLSRWERVYRRKCDRKAVPCPLDRI